MTVRGSRARISVAVGLLLGSGLAVLGPRYLAAGTYSYVGDYSYLETAGVSYEGPHSGFRGERVRLRATLRRPDGGGVRGAQIHFHLGTIHRHDRTDRFGDASVRVVLDLAPGAYEVTAAFTGGDGLSPSTDRDAFDVRWEHTFVDDFGTGAIHLNPSTNEFQVDLGDRETGIKHDANMQVVGAAGRRLVHIDHEDAEVTLRGDFELRSGAFAAVVVMDGDTFLLARSPI